MESFFKMMQFLLPGLGVTLCVTLIALFMGCCIGAIMAVLRVYGGVTARTIATSYSIVVRAIPVVVIIFILYFVVSEFVDLSPFMSGALALGFASGAYQTEIFRGAILSVPQGQMTAARGIGMGRAKAIRCIIMPQAMRIAIPSLINEVSLVLKDSSLVFVIGVPELLRRAQYASASTMEPLLAFGTAALFYILLTLVLSKVLEAIEQRFAVSF
ncbi:GlnP4 [Desulforapulum autotrophicum HRM2]|uniref:GlnP4 n=1 Tax=Desulforapulum autotrophicum (strain ATCC 43914 / DSM 3382 / VKM B-1955 / HRM2) TaxID=177437 RepID=C0QCR0_DESAH|nr:amino acid ABC transporter permease [Desulforapulum autotrophicum]ACN15137.1 GlnP4 [Desulforapulum autotrophicum HRM2]